MRSGLIQKKVKSLSQNTLQQAAEFYKKNEPSLYIETCKGKRFYIDDPKFDIDEIAHALSMQCRYTGHTDRFYSVAEHSVLVANIMTALNLGDPLEGLLHDANEAYLSDIASPWKALLPDYKKIEAKIEGPMRKHFGLPEKITDGCKYADWVALFAEAHVMIPTGGEDWITPDPKMREDAKKFHNYQFGMDHQVARKRFLYEYTRLSKRTI
jgi:hypothetical protein